MHKIAPVMILDLMPNSNSKSKIITPIGDHALGDHAHPR
jgi:hypothetical protein